MIAMFSLNSQRAFIDCTAPYCTVLYCTVLHYAALHCTTQHCTALHSTALNGTVLFQRNVLVHSSVDRINCLGANENNPCHAMFYMRATQKKMP